MFKTALIGIDEVDAGRDALALARKLCDPAAHYSLARVHGASRVISHGTSTALQAAEIRTAEVALHRAARLTGVTDTVSIGAISVGDGLGRLAAQRRVDLLAVGSSRSGPEGVVNVGEWLAQALTRAACAVAVAPQGYRRNVDAMRTVGVAFDDSPESRHARVLARHLAHERGLELVVFEASTVAGRGHRSGPHQVALQLSEFSAHVDLLVVGPRGAGPLSRLTHPSATLSLVHSSESPLLLITHQTRTPLGFVLDEEWAAAVPTAAERLL